MFYKKIYAITLYKLNIMWEKNGSIITCIVKATSLKNVECHAYEVLSELIHNNFKTISKHEVKSFVLSLSVTFFFCKVEKK
jgi:hypothetical protein